MLGLRLTRFRAKAGVPRDATLYGIRHQFGTMAVVNGVDIKTLSELMGQPPHSAGEGGRRLGRVARPAAHNCRSWFSWSL